MAQAVASASALQSSVASASALESSAPRSSVCAFGLVCLTQLSLGGVGLGRRGAEALAKPLPFLSRLSHLGLGRNALGEAGLELLLPALHALMLLRTLGLQHNDLGPSCSTLLAQLIASLGAVEDVLLYGNSLHLGLHGIRPLEPCRHLITWDTDI